MHEHVEADLDLERVESLLAQLRAGTMSWREALTASGTDSSTKAWQTSGWRRRRDALLKPACEQCGSEKPPLVLQHLWHPRRFAEIRDEVQRPYLDAYAAENPSPRIADVEEVDRDACPECGHLNIIYQKTFLRWKCNYAHCGVTFQVPATVRAQPKDARPQWYRRRREAVLQWLEPFNAEFGDRIATETAILSIEEHLRYLRCDDTVTFCKRCAYLWDVKGMRLCGRCRTHYHSHDYPVCWTCSQAAKAQADIER